MLITLLNKLPDEIIVAAAKAGGIHANKLTLQNLLIISHSNKLNTFSYKNKIKKLLYLGSSCITQKASQPINEKELLSGPLEKQ